MKMRTKKLQRIFLALVLVLTVVSGLGAVQVQADIFGLNDNLNGMDGNAQYASEEYRDNYSLDTTGLGMFDVMDKALASITNLLFLLVVMIGKLACSVIYHALNFDMAQILTSLISDFINSLNDSIFKPLFAVAFCATAWTMIKRLFRSDIAGTAAEIGKAVFVCVLSALITTNASGVLTLTFNLTKSINRDIIASSSTEDEEGGSTYAKTAAGEVWYNLIHIPWLSLEFGNDIPDDKIVNDILKESSDSNKRNDLIEDYENETETKAFSSDRLIERIVLTIIYLIPLLLKALIFMVLSLSQVMYQTLAIFFLVLAPIMLLLTLLPNLGFPLLTRWMMKILETQIMCIVLTVFLTLLLSLDMWLFNNLSGTLGWLVTVIFQIVIYVIVILKRKEIFSMFSKAGQFVSHARMQMPPFGGMGMHGNYGHGHYGHSYGYGYGGPSYGEYGAAAAQPLRSYDGIVEKYGKQRSSMVSEGNSDAQTASEAAKKQRGSTSDALKRQNQSVNKTSATGKADPGMTARTATAATTAAVTKGAGKANVAAMAAVNTAAGHKESGLDPALTVRQRPSDMANTTAHRQKDSPDMPEDVRMQFYEQDARQFEAGSANDQNVSTSTVPGTPSRSDEDNKQLQAKIKLEKRMEEDRKFLAEHRAKAATERKAYYDRVRQEMKDGTYIAPWKKIP